MNIEVGRKYDAVAIDDIGTLHQRRRPSGNPRLGLPVTNVEQADRDQTNGQTKKSEREQPGAHDQPRTTDFEGLLAGAIDPYVRHFAIGDRR